MDGVSGHSLAVLNLVRAKISVELSTHSAPTQGPSLPFRDSAALPALDRAPWASSSSPVPCYMACSGAVQKDRGFGPGCGRQPVLPELQLCALLTGTDKAQV